MMKRILGLMIAAGLVFIPAAEAGNLAKRQARQRARITDGVRAGDLTRNEARSLRKSQSRIHRQIRRDRVDGLGLTPRERAKAERLLDRQSRRIARARRN